MTIVVILTQNHHGPFLHRNPIPDNPRFQTSTEHLVLLSSSGSNHPRHLHCPGSALPRAFAFHLYSCLHARFRYYFILLHLSREARLALERWCPSIKPALISEKHNGGHRVKLGGALLLPIPLHELLEKITCISNHSFFFTEKVKSQSVKKEACNNRRFQLRDSYLLSRDGRTGGVIPIKALGTDYFKYGHLFDNPGDLRKRKWRWGKNKEIKFWWKALVPRAFSGFKPRAAWNHHIFGNISLPCLPVISQTADCINVLNVQYFGSESKS